ncbi:aldo/keto reductase [Streptomyces sp. NPDC059467]|uniref:aldo/keto reductase n=1 Tax=Streptomyces sp. NPDC059467 TaxID=3346844 RepID=UPI0036A833AD
MTQAHRLIGDTAIPPLGMGCWAIGGPFRAGDTPVGWGKVDDAESTRAVRRAVDLGIRFFDTSDVYGTGHSERILGAALAGHRDDVLIATKWGNVFDEGSRRITGEDPGPAHVRHAVEASLTRLGTDRVDLYQWHLGGASAEQAQEMQGALEDLVAAGKIRHYGWSTDDPALPTALAGPHFAAVQHELNVLSDAPDMLRLVAEHNWASVNRSPLAMGLLSEKYTGDTRLAQDDVRGDEAPPWMRYFADGAPAGEWLKRRDAVREILTSDGRSLVQGALAWNWARSPHTVPIPGFRTVAQVEENADALGRAPLTAGELSEIDALLGR